MCSKQSKFAVTSHLIFHFPGQFTSLQFNLKYVTNGPLQIDVSYLK